MRIRRNFVRPNWKIAPYFEYRLGPGRIDAKGPEGVCHFRRRKLDAYIKSVLGDRPVSAEVARSSRPFAEASSILNQ